MPMKKVILFLMISTSVFIYSCKCDRAPESKSLTELIEYDAMINNNGLMDPIMGHLNEDMRLNFIHFLFEELKNNNAVDDNGNNIDTKQVISVINELINNADTTLTDPEDFIKSNVIKINKLRFREKWIYNTTDFKIDKTVLAVAPLLELADSQGYVFKAAPLFCIKFDTSAQTKDNIILSTNIIGDAFIYNNLEMIHYYDSAPASYYCNLNYEAKSQYFDALVKSVVDNKIKGYNFFFNPLEEADMKVLKGYADTLKDYDENNNIVETIIEHKVSAQEFVRIKFAEQWEYSKKPFVFRKTVKARSPSVMVIDPQYDVVKGYKPLFWIVYDENYLQEMKGKILQ